MAYGCRGIRVPYSRAGEAWLQAVIVGTPESSHLKSKAGSRENDPAIESVSTFSKPNSSSKTVLPKPPT